MIKYFVTIERNKVGVMSYLVLSLSTGRTHSAWSSLNEARKACNDLNRWTKE
jgi:hypothetical protein